jgi:hypothetical protein
MKIIFNVIIAIIFFYSSAKTQDTIRYPFRADMNISFSSLLKNLGHGWMYKDKGCSTGLYFVEIWFEKDIDEPRIFIPDDMPRQFADSVRGVFFQYLIILDTSKMKKNNTPFIQPIYIEDADCFISNEELTESNKNKIYLDMRTREAVSLKKSISAFFSKTGNIVEPRRYYILDFCIISSETNKSKWKVD